MKPAAIEKFFATLQATHPQPSTELLYSSTFELLVAVLLSAQATDVSVNKVTRQLFLLANTPQKILALGLEGLEAQIKTIGLFRSKARHLRQTCEILLAQHAGQVPNSRQALQALPGVGRKTANVILNVAFGEPTIAVDTHLFRLGNRTGMASGKTPLAVERKLLQRIPKPYLLHAHHWLILHGRYICQARTPRCWQCAVSHCCDYKHKTPAPSQATTPQVKA
jgi:endonuclease-3